MSKKELLSRNNNWPITDGRLKKLQHVLENRQSGLTVILEQVDDPHNISAVLRTCDAIGIYEVFVIIRKNSIRKKLGRRSSASAMKWIRVHEFSCISDCLEQVRKKYPLVLCTHLNSEAKSVYETSFTQSMAIAFGNEHDGISDELLQAADGNIQIPQRGMVPSLNISVACAVILFEAYRQRIEDGYADKHRLPKAEQIELMKTWARKGGFNRILV